MNESTARVQQPPVGEIGELLYRARAWLAQPDQETAPQLIADVVKLLHASTIYGVALGSALFGRLAESDECSGLYFASDDDTLDLEPGRVLVVPIEIDEGPADG